MFKHIESIIYYLDFSISTFQLTMRQNFFLKNTFILHFTFSLFVLPISSWSQQTSFKIDEERIELQLKRLSLFGMNDKGGNDRVAFSDYDLEARAYLTTYLTELGLDVTVDAAGNLLARKAGKNPDLKPIAFGSHIDAVPNGGHYDGDVGVIGAIEVLETLIENKIETAHPLELIIFSNEEGAIFGSRAIAGKIDMETLEGKN